MVAPSGERLRVEGRYDVFANTPYMSSTRKRSPEGATVVVSHLNAAYYSFINPKRMKG